MGLSSMLAVRGEGTLSWVGDENFVVQDDNTSANQEVIHSLFLTSVDMIIRSVVYTCLAIFLSM